MSEYVGDKFLINMLLKLLFVTCHMWYVTSDTTPDTLHMGVCDYGVDFNVSSRYGLRVRVF